MNNLSADISRHWRQKNLQVIKNIITHCTGPTDPL